MRFFRVESVYPMFKEVRKVEIMPKVRLAIASLGFAMLLMTATALQAQMEAPAAPLPSQVISARKVFISNAAGDTVFWSGELARPYNEFYAAIKNWGRYEIV